MLWLEEEGGDGSSSPIGVAGSSVDNASAILSLSLITQSTSVCGELC